MLPPCCEVPPARGQPQQESRKKAKPALHSAVVPEGRFLVVSIVVAGVSLLGSLGILLWAWDGTSRPCLRLDEGGLRVQEEWWRAEHAGLSLQEIERRLRDEAKAEADLSLIHI